MWWLDKTRIPIDSIDFWWSVQLILLFAFSSYDFPIFFPSLTSSHITIQVVPSNPVDVRRGPVLWESLPMGRLSGSPFLVRCWDEWPPGLEWGVGDQWGMGQNPTKSRTPEWKFIEYVLWMNTKSPFPIMSRLFWCKNNKVPGFWPKIPMSLFHVSYSQNLPEWKVVFETSCFFLKLSWGLEKIIHSSKNDNICYIRKTWKTIISLQKKLMTWIYKYTKYWPWPMYVNARKNGQTLR